jgi:hypothetical protein
LQGETRCGRGITVGPLFREWFWLGELVLLCWWWFVSDGLALACWGGCDSRGNLLLANRDPSDEPGLGESRVLPLAWVLLERTGSITCRYVVNTYVFYMDCKYLLTGLRESFINEVVLNYLPALTHNYMYISLHSHSGN